jgi:glycosyltransferase involved in cell wall biosynthesis
MLSKADVYHAWMPEMGGFLPYIKSRSVVTFHDFFPLTEKSFYSWKYPFIKFSMKVLMNGASKAKIVVCNSSQTKRELATFFKRTENVRVINDGVNDNIKPMKIKKEKITLGFFASFARRKRVDIAIEAFKKLKRKIDCKLIIAGGEIGGGYQKNFDVISMTKNLSDVEIIGPVPEKDVPRLYNSFDFYLFPSKAEGFGIPILEAQRCGVPVIIMKDAHIPEETRKMAIECASPEDMANKILYLINHSGEYRKISKESIKYAKQFTWDKYVNAYLEVYEEVVRR